MNKLKFAVVIALSVVILCSCTSRVFTQKFGEVRKNYNDDLSLNQVGLTGSDVPDDFLLFLEAEQGTLVGCYPNNRSDASGGQTVSGLDTKGESITFDVIVPSDGMYDFTFGYFSNADNRENYLYVDGVQTGTLKCNIANVIDDYTVKGVFLSEGEHKVSVEVSWGWVEYDCLSVTKSNSVNENTYNVTCSLSNPNADENTVRLYNFLCDIYGKYTLTGQFCDKGRAGEEYERILEVTGKEFAVLGLDMMNYTLVNKDHGSVGDSMEYASDWYHNAGGIVQMCWHWNSPNRYVKAGANWWNSFYAENSDLDLDKIMNGEDETGYKLLMKDIRNIAEELTKLRDDGTPIIWRPLHEAAGGWFWWGNCEPESYIKLWREMYDIMTNEYNLTNLIWMWNGQNNDWYPGDDVVDIVSWDIYADKHQYGSFSTTFVELTKSYTETKLIALSENGVVMDPELCYRDNARWLFWGTWSGDFALTTIYTEDDMLKKAYDSEFTLTLDELPNLKKYRLE